MRTGSTPGSAWKRSTSPTRSINHSSRPVIRRLIIHPDDREPQRAFEAAVTDGRLTLVFYTTLSRSMDPQQLPIWGVSGMVIERIE